MEKRDARKGQQGDPRELPALSSQPARDWVKQGLINSASVPQKCQASGRPTLMMFSTKELVALK